MTVTMEMSEYKEIQSALKSYSDCVGTLLTSWNNVMEGVEVPEKIKINMMALGRVHRELIEERYR